MPKKEENNQAKHGSQSHSEIKKWEAVCRSNSEIEKIRAVGLILSKEITKILLQSSADLVTLCDLTQAELRKIAPLHANEPDLEGWFCAQYIFQLESGDGNLELDEKAKNAKRIQNLCIGLRKMAGSTAEGPFGWSEAGDDLPTTVEMVNWGPGITASISAASTYMREESGSGTGESSATLLLATADNLKSSARSKILNGELSQTVGRADQGPSKLSVALRIAKQAGSGQRTHQDEVAAADVLKVALERAMEVDEIRNELETLIKNVSGDSDMNNLFNIDYLVILSYKVAVCINAGGAVDIDNSLVAAYADLDRVAGLFEGTNVSKDNISKNLMRGSDFMVALDNEMDKAKLTLHSSMCILDATRLADALSLIMSCPSRMVGTMLSTQNPAQGLACVGGMARVDMQYPNEPIHNCGHLLHRCLMNAFKHSNGRNASRLQRNATETRFASNAETGTTAGVRLLYTGKTVAGGWTKHPTLDYWYTKLHELKEPQPQAGFGRFF